MSDHFPVVIHHNPSCGTSRNVLAMIEAAGYTPTVNLYLETGWTIPQLKDLLAGMGATVRGLLRENGTPAKDLGLLDPDVSDEAILSEMVAHPILVNRPIVVTPKGVKLCRPSEAVLPLLERQPAQFTKEDGEAVKPHGKA
jgi:arsenate reductase